MDGMTIDTFCDGLKQYEEHLSMRFGSGKHKKNQNKDEEQLLFAGDQFRAKRNPRFLKCYNCGRRGHLAWDCWSKNQDKEDSPEELALTADEDISNSSTLCYVDSGASRHMTGSKHLLQDYEDLDKPADIITANGVKMSGIGEGKMKMGPLI